jgi:hypothetical protein
MAHKVVMAFEPKGIVIDLERLLPLRAVTASVRNGEKYRRISASIREVGMIEPLIVYPQKGTKGSYLVLDGTLRLDILKKTGRTEALCLIATEDEAYTYNHKVNRLAPIQEHFMIIKALENGVSEGRIAATLAVNVAAIRQKQNLLTGICPEAVALLKAKPVCAAALRELKRVVPLRQIEMAEIMVSSNTYSASYAKCLYAASHEDQKLDAQKPADEHGISAEDRARMELEMRDMLRNYRAIEETHGENVLNLVLGVGYLKKLLNNARVVRYLSKRHADILAEFQKIVEAPELDVGDASPDR